MKAHKTINILKEADSSFIQNLVAKLNSDGICSDEDSIGIASLNIEGWDDECTEFLKTNGFHGESLSNSGRFYEGHGAVYVIFDNDVHTYDSAEKYMKIIVTNENH
jgi:hypothetical protein